MNYIHFEWSYVCEKMAWPNLNIIFIFIIVGMFVEWHKLLLPPTSPTVGTHKNISGSPSYVHVKWYNTLVMKQQQQKFFKSIAIFPNKSWNSFDPPPSSMIPLVLSNP